MYTCDHDSEEDEKYVEFEKVNEKHGNNQVVGNAIKLSVR